MIPFPRQGLVRTFPATEVRSVVPEVLWATGRQRRLRVSAIAVGVALVVIVVGIRLPSPLGFPFVAEFDDANSREGTSNVGPSDIGSPSGSGEEDRVLIGDELACDSRTEGADSRRPLSVGEADDLRRVGEYMRSEPEVYLGSRLEAGELVVVVDPSYEDALGEQSERLSAITSEIRIRVVRGCSTALQLREVLQAVQELHTETASRPAMVADIDPIEGVVHVELEATDPEFATLLRERFEGLVQIQVVPSELAPGRQSANNVDPGS